MYVSTKNTEQSSFIYRIYSSRNKCILIYSSGNMCNAYCAYITKILVCNLIL